MKLAIVSGIFLNTHEDATVVNENTPADLFIVADDVNNRKLQLFLKALEAERNLLIEKMLNDKKAGAPTQSPSPKKEGAYSCGEDHEHN